MNEDLILKVDGPVARFTLNREKNKNALNANIVEGLFKGLDEISRKADVKVVCIEGGREAFSSGADLKGILNIEDALNKQKEFADLLIKLKNFPKPLLALVEGVCMGGGLGIALCCDFILANENAIFATPEIKVGLYPLMISPLLRSHLGPKKAQEMILTGKSINAKEAEKIGLITSAFLTDEFDSSVNELIQSLCQNNGFVIELGKRAVEKNRSLNFEDSVYELCDEFKSLLASPHAKKLIQKFISK